MMLQGVSAALLARLLWVDSPGDDSWLLFGPTDEAVTAEAVEEAEVRWAAE